MKVSQKTIDTILSYVEDPALMHFYRKALPIVAAKRTFFEMFRKSEVAQLHIEILERTFNLPIRVIDMGPQALATVLNMYLIELTPSGTEYPDFDWLEFKNETLKRMKLIRDGASEELLKRRGQKIYRISAAAKESSESE